MAIFRKEYQALSEFYKLPKEVAVEKLNACFKSLTDHNKELGFIIKSGKRKSERIITAHGNADLFNTVENMVAKAPKLKKMEIYSPITT